jgi:hypothetical protein
LGNLNSCGTEQKGDGSNTGNHNIQLNQIRKPASTAVVAAQPMAGQRYLDTIKCFDYSFFQLVIIANMLWFGSDQEQGAPQATTRMSATSSIMSPIKMVSMGFLASDSWRSSQRRRSVRTTLPKMVFSVSNGDIAI